MVPLVATMCIVGSKIRPLLIKYIVAVETFVFLRYLHDRVGGQHLVLHLSLLSGSSHHRKVPHGEFGRYRLARTRLAADDDRLIVLLSAKGNAHERKQQIERRKRA